MHLEKGREGTSSFSIREEESERSLKKKKGGENRYQSKNGIKLEEIFLSRNGLNLYVSNISIVMDSR